MGARHFVDFVVLRLISDRNFVPCSRKTNEHGSCPVAGLVADICLVVRKTCQRCSDSLLGTIRKWALNCNSRKK